MNTEKTEKDSLAMIPFAVHEAEMFRMAQRETRLKALTAALVGVLVASNMIMLVKRKSKR